MLYTDNPWNTPATGMRFEGGLKSNTLSDAPSGRPLEPADGGGADPNSRPSMEYVQWL